MITVQDQTGHTVSLPSVAQRIVSIVPSQTELLYSLGLDDAVMGITRFCIHPDHWFRTKTRVGGTKDLRIEQIRSLAPDLVLANKEENNREQVEALREFCPVWTSDIQGPGDALAMISQVGQLTGKQPQADTLVRTIESAFSAMPVFTPVRTLYLIWRNPYMAAGGDTYIDAMMQGAGFDNVLRDRPRYPELTAAAIAALKPELVLLSSEPYPFRDQHRAELQEILPGARILLADGEMFSWYGSRMLEAPTYFQHLRGMAGLNTGG